MHKMNELALSDRVGFLILEELRLIRRDLNCEMKNLKESLDNVLMSKIMSGFNCEQKNPDLHPEDNINLQLYGYDNTATGIDCDSGTWPEYGFDNATGSSDLIEKEQQMACVKEKEPPKEELEICGLRNEKNLHDNGVIDEVKNSSVHNNFQEANLLGSLNVKKRKRKPTKSKAFNIEKPWHCLVCLRTFETKSGLKYHCRLHSAKTVLKKKQQHKKKFSPKFPNISNGEVCELSLVTNESETNEDLPTLKTLFSADNSDSNFNLPANSANNGKKKTSNSMFSAPKKSGQYICSYCNKQFAYEIQLKAHIYTHTKPYKCFKCSKGFAEKKSIFNHKKSPLGCTITPAQHMKCLYKLNCKLCGKALNTQRQFEFHLAMHLGEKPFRCPVCDDGFTQASNLRRHMLKQHNSPAFSILL